VWVGYDSERSLGKKQTGGRVAAPIFESFMEATLGDAPINDFNIPEGVSFVSVNGSLECFKQGTEPHTRQAANEYQDELDRAVERLRGHEPTELDGEHHAAPSGDDLDEEPAPPADDDYELAPARRDEMRTIDDRPPPRADDYLDAARHRPIRDDDANDNQEWRRPAPPPMRPPPPPDDYRVNAPAPPRRRIVEEPLPY
jgi:membrane peptidoglycan carboxypeptidase